MGAMALYATAMAMVGLAIGYFVALSHSPVVGIVLPLLFSLIVGASGIYVTRADLSQTAGRRHLGFVGLCIILLVCTTVASSGTILWLRRGEAGPELMEVAGFDALVPQEQFQLARLRMMARLLGASPKEQKAMLQRAATREPVPADTPLEATAKLDHLTGAFQKTVVQLQSSAGTIHDSDLTDKIDEVISTLEGTIALLSTWKPEVLGMGLPINRQLDVVDGVLADLVGNSGLTPTTNLLALSKTPPILEALVAAQAAVESNHLRVMPETKTALDGADIDQWMGRSIDLLKVISSAPETGQIPEFAYQAPFVRSDVEG